MADSHHIMYFSPFRFDLAAGRLWHEEEEIILRAKTLEVLRYLITHAGRFVSKNELLDAVWPDTYVSDIVPLVCVRELRKALADDAKNPRFIQTMRRRGYRFLPTMTIHPSVSGSEFQVSGLTEKKELPQRGTWDVKRETSLVGRESELIHLHNLFAKALTGERQMVFVTGEPGIGKTTLVETFLDRSRLWALGSGSSSSQLNPSTQHLTPGCWVARGQCIEHYGAGEAYMPVLEALGQLCRSPASGPAVVAVLKQYAPTWLLQMPSLLSTVELEEVQKRTRGTTRERMLREIVEAFLTVTAQQPLVLVLEDLHWSDPSTLDFLTLLAQQRAAAHLMVLGTYRSTEITGNGHPLQSLTQELLTHRQCEEVALPLLHKEAVTVYVASRFAHGTLHTVELPALVQAIYQRTEGNPLFMVNIVEDLHSHEEQGLSLLAQVSETNGDLPSRVRQLIDKQIARLSPHEQEILEVASLVGSEFSLAALAAGVESALEDIEMTCRSLAHRKQFIQEQDVSAWPDGTLTTQYRFRHVLYRQAFTSRIPIGRQVKLHHQIGERKEQAFTQQLHTIAAELAVHFEHGRAYAKAVHYAQLAADLALQRWGYREAITHFSRALQLLMLLPETAERTPQELSLRLSLAYSLHIANGPTAAETEAMYTQAKELCQQIGTEGQHFTVLSGLFEFHYVRGEAQASTIIAEQMFSIAQRESDAALQVWAHNARGLTFFLSGDLLSARGQFEQGFSLYDRQNPLPFIGVASLAHVAQVFAVLGCPDQARQKIQDAITLAQEQAQPLGLAYAFTAAGLVYHGCRESERARQKSEQALKVASEHQLVFLTALTSTLHGALLAEQSQVDEGLDEIERGLSLSRSLGIQPDLPYWLALLASAYQCAGRYDEALAIIQDAQSIATRTEQHLYDALFLGLEGEILLQSAVRGWRLETEQARSPESTVQGPRSKARNLHSILHNPQLEAEECFLKAIAIARQQQAKTFELRAVMNLVRLRQQLVTQSTARVKQREAHDKLHEAHSMLSELYAWFTEGFDTKDLQEARALLADLGR